MSKELWMEAHEELVTEAMLADPTLSEVEAYGLTASAAHKRMIDNMIDAQDALSDRRMGR